MQLSSLLEIISAILISLFPAFLAGDVIKAVFRKPILYSAIGGLLGVYICWHAGMAGNQGIQFNPFFGIILVVITEAYTYLQTLFDLRKRCTSSIGNRFTMPDGSIINLQLTPAFLALIASLVEAFIISRTGVAARITGIVTFLHYPIVRWILIVAGIFAILSILGLLRKLKGSSAQQYFDQAKKLHEGTIREFPHELKPKAEVEELRRNPQLLKAQELYLKAAQADKKADYNKDYFQQSLNQAIAYCQLALLHRHWQQLEEAAGFAKKAYEILEPNRKERSEDSGFLSCLSIAYFRYAEAMHIMGNRKVAADYYRRSLNIDERLGDDAGKRQTLSRLKELDTEDKKTEDE